ncbi:MAG: hypothetical protein AAGB04_27205, partial [Pseudomonadota bacterium]
QLRVLPLVNFSSDISAGHFLQTSGPGNWTSSADETHECDQAAAGRQRMIRSIFEKDWFGSPN